MDNKLDDGRKSKYNLREAKKTICVDKRGHLDSPGVSRAEGQALSM
jgi:hypothetical protein